MFSYLSSVVILYLPPYFAIGFVSLLLAYKFYFKIRSKFNATVNCWFCNQNTRVSYIEANSWTCPKCDQYNGFTKDGDYNRDLHQSYVSAPLSNRAQTADEYSDHNDSFAVSAYKNGFCNDCNERQRLKVEKLAQFEPKCETRFDYELKVYKAQLEDQYRLCLTCDRHLGKVLREKKKMVLGSKFLDFFIKGAESLKQPHFNKIRNVKKQEWKNFLVTLILILTIVNVICLARTLPSPTMENLAIFLDESIAKYAFLGISHVLTLAKVIASYIEHMTNYQYIAKIMLFFKTLLMMVLYSIGIKMQQIAAITLSSVYIVACPFAVMGLAFVYNIIDGFKLTRITFLLTLWSFFAGGFIGEEIILSKEILMAFASFATIWLAATNKKELLGKSHDETGNSFHKMYSTDYETDEDTRETISMLSQNLSTDSGRSIKSNSSFVAHRNKTSLRYRNSPSTSSVMSLNHLNNSQASSSFKTFCHGDSRPLRSSYAGSLNNFTASSPLFASNIELNCFDRPQSATNVMNSSFFEARKNIDNRQITNGNHNFNSQCWNDSFSTSSNNNFSSATNENFTNVPLASPFSVSSSAVYQQRSNLLNPSRFSTNNLTYNDPSSSWLSVGGYKSFVLDQTQCKPNASLETRNMTSIDERISRASSQSSGFESATSGITIPRNISRENSVDLYPNPDESFNSFRSVDSTLVRRDALNQSLLNSTIQPQNALTFATIQPLTVNCNEDYWKLPPPVRSNGFIRDSFNLRKINEQLPSIKRGTLLKKWKDSQNQNYCSAAK